MSVFKDENILLSSNDDIFKDENLLLSSNDDNEDIINPIEEMNELKEFYDQYMSEKMEELSSLEKYENHIQYAFNEINQKQYQLLNPIQPSRMNQLHLLTSPKDINSSLQSTDNKIGAYQSLIISNIEKFQLNTIIRRIFYHWKVELAIIIYQKRRYFKYFKKILKKQIQHSIYLYKIADNFYYLHQGYKLLYKIYKKWYKKHLKLHYKYRKIKRKKKI